MTQQDRAVTPVISTILFVGIVVILAGIVSVAALGIAENITGPTPPILDTAGEFEVGDKQIVRITHVGGDSVAVEDIEIIVRASGPAIGVPAQVRIVNLPGDYTDFCFRRTGNGGVLNIRNLQEDTNLIKRNCAPNKVITDADPNVWSAGMTIQFQIRSGPADFSPDSGADELEVVIVHTESNAIISEHVFRP